MEEFFSVPSCPQNSPPESRKDLRKQGDKLRFWNIIKLFPELNDFPVSLVSIHRSARYFFQNFLQISVIQ